MSVHAFPENGIKVGIANHDENGSEPPMPPTTDDRLSGIETRVSGIENRVTHIEAILPTLATKADMHDMKAEMIKWVVGTAIGLGVAGITVMTFVLNNAVPKSMTSSPPIIINLPSQPPAAK